MYLKITEIAIHERTKGLYVLVDFWPDKAAHDRGDRPEATNDFIMPNLQRTGMRIVTNAEGWFKRKSDGVFVDPDTFGSFDPEPEWERESYDVDIPVFVKNAAKAYYGRYSAAKLSVKPYPKNHSASDRIARTVIDPRGLLRLDVTTMAGKGYEMAVQP